MKISQLLTALALASVAAATPALSLAGEKGAGPDAGAGDPAVLKQLRVEINALNLINGLNLTAAQVQAILEGARKNRDLRERLLGGAAGPEAGADTAKAYEALKVLKARLERGEAVGQADFEALRKDLETGPGRGGRPEREAYDRELRALELAVEKILLESQLEILRAFKPCLVPPKNLKDPVRVGQAADRSRAASALERLRALPASKWSGMADSILEKSLASWEERHGAFEPAERAAELARARAVVEEARGLPEIEFQMRKDDLAARFEFTRRRDELRKELEELRSGEGRKPGKVASILLDPKIIPVLERRLAQMKGFAPEKPADLDKLAGAETGKDGKCGKVFED